MTLKTHQRMVIFTVLFIYFIYIYVVYNSIQTSTLIYLNNMKTKAMKSMYFYRVNMGKIKTTRKKTLCELIIRINRL